MPVADLGIVEGAALGAILLNIVGLVPTLWRLTRGPSLADRVVALDFMAAQIIALIAAWCVLTGQAVFLDAAAVLALVAFLGTVAFARYLEKGVGQND